MASYSSRPEVNVFDKELENGNGMRRFVRIECPGVDEDDINFSDDVPNGVKAGSVSQLVLGSI